MGGSGVTVDVLVGAGVSVSVAVALGRGEADGFGETVTVGDGVGTEQAVSKISKREMRDMFFMGSLLSWGLYSAG